MKYVNCISIIDTLYSGHYTLYSVQRTLYSAQCILYARLLILLINTYPHTYIVDYVYAPMHAFECVAANTRYSEIRRYMTR